MNADFPETVNIWPPPGTSYAESRPA